MDTGIWVFLGYILIGLMLIITISIIYFLVKFAPKVRMFFLLMDRFLKKANEQNENIENVSKEIISFMERIKDIFKK